MNVRYVDANNLQQVGETLLEFEKDAKVNSILFFMADKNHYKDEDISPLLKKSSKQIIGGVFPEIIFDGERKTEGLLIIPQYEEIEVLTLKLDRDRNELFNDIDDKFGDLEDVSGSIYVFCDALGLNKDYCIETLFNYFGINVTYIGGGAGSLSFKQFPCVINNEGLHENVAIIALTSEKKDIGVAHGWSPITEPLKVTKTLKNRIESINWERAFKIYKKVVESHSGMLFSENTFFDIAKSYPFGIAKMDSEMVVRDPFMVDENGMYVVDEILQGEYVCIMYGNIDSLLNGAKTAKSLAFANANPEEKNSFCIDCISRVLYMQDDFYKELDIIKGDGTVNGILTIGEIANSGESFLEIYNKTIVVVKW